MTRGSWARAGARAALPAFLLLAALAPRAAAADAVRAALDRLFELEQVVPQGGLDGQAHWELEFRHKTTAAMRTVSAELKQAGMRVEPTPADWLSRRDRSYVWKDEAVWVSSFTALPEESRCRRVLLAYAFGVWQLTGLTAEEPVKELNDLLLGDYTDKDALWRDRARAAWAMRHVHALPMDLVPPACEESAREARARWDFIFDSDKRPTGLARYMCGRPMNSHWADDDIDAGRRPEPRGWTHRVD